MADINVQVEAEEIAGRVDYSEGNLLGNAQKIINANEEYKTAFGELKNYFESTDKDGLGAAVTGKAYDAMKGVFDNNKEKLTDLYEYIDGFVAQMRSRTAAGASEAENGFGTIQNKSYD